MDRALLQELARHQIWADAQHWKMLRANPALLEDEQIRKRLNHILSASLMLQGLARGETPDLAQFKDRESVDEIETAMTAANEQFLATLTDGDLDKPVTFPRGPRGPFEAPAHVVYVQVVTHSQHHRAQNAARMHELGVKPVLTDYILWYGQGRP